MKKTIELEYLELEPNTISVLDSYPDNGLYLVTDGVITYIVSVTAKNNGGYTSLNPVPVSCKISDCENNEKDKDEKPKRNGVGEWVSGNTLKEIIQILTDKKS